MSYSLNSLKGGYIRIILGTTIGVFKGDTRSLDYSSYKFRGFWGYRSSMGIMEKKMGTIIL